MHLAYSVAEIRAAEAPLISAAADRGDPDAVMRRAAAGVDSAVRRLLRQRPGKLYGAHVLLLVGSGDNGGDALYAGATLRSAGVAVTALLLGSRVHERALAAFRRAGGRVLDGAAEEATGATAEAANGSGMTTPAPPDVAVDGVVGLGGRGPLREPAASVVTDLHSTGVPIVAVDIPSGVDADTGIAHDPSVRATTTVTFGAYRRAHLLASPQCGDVEFVDIGLTLPDHPADPLTTVFATAAGARWPVPGPADDKYTQGVVAVRAGSPKYPGAAVLSAVAAVAATSGMVRYCGPGVEEVLRVRPEIVAAGGVTSTGRAQAWVAGPGMGTGPDAVADLDAILGRGVPTLLDADALTCVADFPALLRRRKAPIVLTPHAGEFTRLTGRELTPESDRSAELRAYLQRLREQGVDATVLLKGRVTLVDDGVRQYAVDAGSSWAATAGSGDVLSGLAGALLAARTEESPATVLADAATLHSVAALRAAGRHDPGGRSEGPQYVAGQAPGSQAPGSQAVGAPIGASDLLAAIPGTIADLRARASREIAVGARPAARDAGHTPPRT